MQLFLRTVLVAAAPAALHASGGWIWEPSSEKAPPAWVESVRAQSGEAVDTFEFRIRPVFQPGKALAVTLFYQDGNGGIIRVLWSGATGDILLGDRLLEGVPMLNRRTLLVSEGEAAAGGRILVQSDAGSVRLKRVALDWVVPTAFYAADEASAPYVRLRDQEISKAETEGAPPEPRDDAVHARVVSALLHDAPVGLSEDPAFQAELAEMPDRVLWECEVANLSPGSPLCLWINNKMAGVVAVHQPDLWDPGWFRETDGTFRYAGWRKARFWVDPSLLSSGANNFQLDAPLGFGGGPSVRRVLLQAAFDRPVAAQAGAAPVSAETHPTPTP